MPMLKLPVTNVPTISKETSRKNRGARQTLSALKKSKEEVK